MSVVILQSEIQVFFLHCFQLFLCYGWKLEYLLNSCFLLWLWSFTLKAMQPGRWLVLCVVFSAWYTTPSWLPMTHTLHITVHCIILYHKAIYLCDRSFERLLLLGSGTLSLSSIITQQLVSMQLRHYHKQSVWLSLHSYWLQSLSSFRYRKLPQQ